MSLILLITLNGSCTKEKPAPEPEFIVKAVYFQDTVLLNTFQYDNQGRVIRSTHRADYGIMNYDTIFYSYRNDTMREDIHYATGQSRIAIGLINGYKLFTITGPYPKAADNRMLYLYDDHGYLITEQCYTYDKEDYDFRYTITDGNVTLRRYFFPGLIPRTDSIWYTDHQNTINYPNTGVTFLGNACNNLPSRGVSMGIISTFSYDFDEYGRVVRMTEHTGDIVTKYRYTY